jgi:hypothetical protein
MKPKEWQDYVKADDMSVAFLWLNFAGFVLPPNAPEIQRDEMKKAFYAGFLECFKVMNDYATALPDDEATKLFARLSRESKDFYRLMLEECP